MFGGDPSRNAASADGNPWLKAKYRTTTAADPLIRERIVEIQRRQRQGREAAIPSLHPLAIADTIVLRTATAIRAVNLADGAVLWEDPLEDPLGYFLRFADAERKKAAAEILAHGLARRLWEDVSFGTMTSDGRLVFGLECGTFDLGPEQQAMVILPNGRRQLDPGMLKKYNTLTVYDVKTGKIQWELGGPSAGGANRVGGAFFLAPPLPLDDKLYVAAEIGNETRLLVLQSSTGTVLERWTLAVRGEQDPNTMAFNRFAPQQPAAPQAVATPSSADGILVAGTPENRYVAIDLTTRSVLWAYEGPQENVNSRNFRMWRVQQFPQAERADRWCDLGVTIAAGRALVCPRNSEQLVCLHLANGNVEWSLPRRDGLYVGGVRDGRVIIVGRKSVRAVRLADGGAPGTRGTPGCPLWPSPTAEVTWVRAAITCL